MFDDAYIGAGTPPQNLTGAPLTLSLLKSSGQVHDGGAGLNWGQPSRTVRGTRTGNEAYIHVPIWVQRSAFFPPSPEQFVVSTDDAKCFIFRREGANGKNLTTPQNNSLLGQYFRARLGVRSGEFIETQHIWDYGRTDVSFYRNDDGTYFMDFSI